jgi:hypothetical protein
VTTLYNQQQQKLSGIIKHILDLNEEVRKMPQNVIKSRHKDYQDDKILKSLKEGLNDKKNQLFQSSLNENMGELLPWKTPIHPHLSNINDLRLGIWKHLSRGKLVNLIYFYVQFLNSQYSCLQANEPSSYLRMVQTTIYLHLNSW